MERLPFEKRGVFCGELNTVHDKSANSGDGDTAVLERVDVEEETAVEPPHQWNVILHNDDFTPFDFVVALLCQLFGYKRMAAFRKAKEINDGGATGKAVIATYPKAIAEAKAGEVYAISQQYGFPLKATTERSDA